MIHRECFKDGATPVFIAAQEEHAPAIAALHAAGANVNTSMSDGRAPVWVAAQNQHQIETLRQEVRQAELKATVSETKLSEFEKQLNCHENSRQPVE